MRAPASVDVVVVEHARARSRSRFATTVKGFDVEAPTGGFGLTGIRERISLAGGRLEILSSEHGTSVLGVGAVGSGDGRVTGRDVSARTIAVTLREARRDSARSRSQRSARSNVKGG